MINPTELAQSNDATLVAESRTGNREAFRQIVAQYQTLICSLAYSGTGSLSQSEDLAQETFIIAWKQLPSLREPLKLRSWLCGIARNLICDALKMQGREPSHAAESLEAIETAPAPGPQPPDLAIENEEAAILWRSLERLPETYREPLVLFYREHQSIETVAAHLDLSEDAVRQRLSRGRRLLQEQVLAFVEGALARTNPGPAFTSGVLAALPAIAVSAKVAGIGAAAKGAGLLGLGGAILTPLLAFMGMWTDYRLRLRSGQARPALRSLRDYYLGIAFSVVVFALACTALMVCAGRLVRANPALFAGLMIGLITGYGLVLGVLARRFTAATRMAAAGPIAADLPIPPKSSRWEYRSRFEPLGWPFLHLRFGGWFGARTGERPTGPEPAVKAWIAITDTSAVGVVFAYGARAIAPISIGAFAVGVISFGGLAIGALAIGGLGCGIWALGPFAFGWQAFGGGCAIAWNAAWSGQYAVARQFAFGQVASAAQTNNEVVRRLLDSSLFFRSCFSKLTFARMISATWLWAVPLIVSQIVQGIVAFRRHPTKG
jgi:RNA polymerase sigma factor (sigma-70 family)